MTPYLAWSTRTVGFFLFSGDRAPPLPHRGPVLPVNLRLHQAHHGVQGEPLELPVLLILLFLALLAEAPCATGTDPPWPVGEVLRCICCHVEYLSEFARSCWSLWSGQSC
jgi:hypothetical protein